MATRAQSKYILKGGTSKTTTPPRNQYSLIDQLQKTLAHISILELLKISLVHKDILEGALIDTTVANDLDINRFQDMVGHLTTPHNLSFSEHDNVSLNHPHNTAFHIKFLVHKHLIKHVLIIG